MTASLLAPDLRELIAHNDNTSLKTFCAGSHPGVVAELLAGLVPTEIWQLLSMLDAEQRVDIFSHLDEDIQVGIAESIGRRELAALVSDMASDERVDLLKRIPEDRRQALLPAIAHAEREDIRKLSAYAEGTAGAVMTSEYATLAPELTARQAIAKLRQEAPDKETIYYAYVLDGQRRLLGFVSLKDLILARADTRIEDMMHQDVISVGVEDDQEEAARIIQKYDLLALPVVNGSHALVGIITHDDAIDVITQEQTEDMEKLMAISGTHETAAYIRTSSWAHFKNRCGWVFMLALLGLVSGYIVQRFEGLLMQIALLATFMPMLADTGGNTGSQAATLVVRALALKEVTVRDTLAILFKETKVSILLGLVLGGFGFARVLLFSANETLPAGISLTTIAVAIATALGLQVITATLIGALLPLVAARSRFDPAVVASPALTTIVDITGLVIYFVTVKTVLGL